MGLSSCIEIVDDLRINEDGSGVLNYNINLSSSKVKINSIFALDSLDGKKVPTKLEIEREIRAFRQQLAQQPGIKGVDLTLDFENYLFKWQVSFEDIDVLQEALNNTAKSMSKKQGEWFAEDLSWLQWDEEALIRSVPEIHESKVGQLKPEDRDLLRTGSYISITRFSVPVDTCDHPDAVISKNRKAVMIRTDALSLSQNLSSLSNAIYLKPDEE